MTAPFHAEMYLHYRGILNTSGSAAQRSLARSSAHYHKTENLQLVNQNRTQAANLHLPSLADTVELITNCIRSSKNKPQLDTCRDMMNRYVKERFEYYVNVIELAEVLSDLDKEIEDQRAVIVEEKYAGKSVLTNENY